jgi:argininosuccinate lyase
MATLSKEQVEQKLQKLQQLSEELNALTKELAEADIFEMSEDELDQVAGGNSKVLRTLIARFNDPKVITTADRKKKSNAFF